MLGQSSNVSYSHQNIGESSYKHMCGNEWFLSLIERLHSTIHVSSLITV
jgi:hypothetical protein